MKNIKKKVQQGLMGGSPEFSKSNKIYFSLISLIYFLFVIIFSDRTAYQFGYFLGGLLVSLLIPFLISTIVWSIFGKKNIVRSITFNIVLTIIIFSNIGNYSKVFIPHNEIFSLMNDYELLKNDIVVNVNNAEILDSLGDQFYTDYLSTLDKLSKETHGKDAEFYALMYEHVQERLNYINEWQNSYRLVNESHILDISILDNKDEIVSQKNIFKQYLNECNIYNQYYLSSIDSLRNKLITFGSNHELSKGALAGAEDRYKIEKPIITSLINAHIQYGNLGIKLLDIIDKSIGKWTLNDDFIVFENEETSDLFFSKLKKLTLVEEKIQLLSAELLKSM